MKLFATVGTMLSLGLCAAVSFAQTYDSRMEPAHRNQDFTSQARTAPGRRYEEVRTAYKLKFQQDAAPKTQDALPSPSDATSKPDTEIIGSSPSVMTPTPAGAHSGHAYSGQGCQSCQENGYASSAGYGDGSYCAGDCGGQWSDGLVCNQGHCCTWFGGVYGLVMARDDDFGNVLSYDAADPSTRLLTSDDGFSDYSGGFGASIGHYISNCWALQAGYWGIYPDAHECNVYDTDTAGGLYTGLGFNSLEYDSGTATAPLQQYFGNAAQGAIRHRLQRSYEVHNVELNLIRNPYRRSGCTHYELLAGARYLKFDDGLLFSGDTLNDVFEDDPNNEVHYGIDVDNHLVGFQVGGRVDHYVHGCLSVNAGAKLGIYNNHVTHEQSIRGGNGFATTTTTGENYDIRNSTDEVAFLGELFAGVSYDIGCRWRVTGGYQVVTVDGVATAQGQIPRDRSFYLLDQASAINNNNCLLLHGAYFGVEYCW